MTAQTGRDRIDDVVATLCKLTRELDRARVNLIDAYADYRRGRIASVGDYQKAYNDACERLAAAQLEAAPFAAHNFR